MRRDRYSLLHVGPNALTPLYRSKSRIVLGIGKQRDSSLQPLNEFVHALYTCKTGRSNLCCRTVRVSAEVSA